jgi:catecholate siderophore receptor
MEESKKRSNNPWRKRNRGEEIKKAIQITTLIVGHDLGAIAHAQSTNTPPATSGNTNTAPKQLPDVIVTGEPESYKPDFVALPKLPEPLRDTPQSITVVPREVMNDQNSTTLRDALRNVAGISIAAGEGGSQGDNLTLRGFTARGDIFLDGMRDFGSYYRDPFNLEAVDALKGPESVMFGRGSTGGVINQESKSPSLTPAISGELSLGTDLTRRATADINEPVPQLGERTAFRLNLLGHESQVADRDVGENRRFGFAPTLTLGLGTPTRLSLSYFHQSEDDIPDYGVPWVFDHPADVPRHNFYGFKSDFLKTDADIGTVRLEHDFNEKFTLRDQARYANYSRDFRITEARTNAAPVLNLTRNELAGESTETFLQNQVDLTANFDTAFVEHTVVTGLEAGRETSSPKRLNYTGVPATNLQTPDEDDSFSGTASVRSDVDTTAVTVGVYAIDSLKLNEHWTVSGGFRWDYFDADYKDALFATNHFTRVDEMPSWRAALVYKPVRNGSIYFDYGTSFNPSAETLALSAGNANLPPEKNETFELGTKWDLLHERLTLRGAVFQTDKTNARETNPLDATQVVLAGEQRVRGVEFEVAGHLTEGWQVFAGYSYLDSEVTSSRFFPASVGFPLANVPKHTFNLWTTYELPWNLQIGGGLNYVGSRTASSTVPLDPTTGRLKQAPDYWTLNAMIKYRLNKHVDLQANVYNLTDNYYYDQIHPAHIIPGAGISALFSASFRF